MKNPAEDLRGKTVDQLNEELMGLRKEQFNLRFQRASGQLENLARIKTVRRQVARIKTIMGQKQQADASASAGASARK